MDLVGGGVDSRGSYVLKILYVEMKESGPLGWGVPSRSDNEKGDASADHCLCGLKDF